MVDAQIQFLRENEPIKNINNLGQAQVLLVDENDRPIGAMEKLEAHQKGVLHRAFSIYIFNSKNQFLLQKRADNKYHAAGLWTNTCCSHPISADETTKEAKKRLEEEMGMRINHLTKAFDFIYRAEFDNGLIEHELDHVYFGFSDDIPKLNLEEAQDYKYVYFEDLHQEVESHPDKFTPWFKMTYIKTFDKAVLEE